MLPSEYLRKGWTQIVTACDTNKLYCGATDKSAACWCYFGAVLAAFFPGKAHIKFMHLSSKIIGNSVVDWNDAPGRTQSEAVALAERVEVELGLREVGNG